MSALSLALLPDYLEERWPSMDLCAEMLQSHLERLPGLRLQNLRPPFRARSTRLPLLGRRRAAFNFDRLVNRLVDYPRHVRRYRTSFDCYHLCDHSYSQLLHELPPERCGVYCHDLDTFRCVLTPRLEPRPGWFRRMVRRTLDGLRKASVVFFSTHAIRQQILEHRLMDPDKLVHAPYGISPEFRPQSQDGLSEPEAFATELPSETGDQPFLLHVGSCIPRKRIDVLLQMFAEVRRREPEMHLVQVGGEWTTDQQMLIDRLELRSSIRQVRGVPRETIAALARRTLLLLIPSEAEGFGLPVIEGLACGAVVVASDIPVLREVGGEAALYAPVADVQVWSEIVLGLIRGRVAPPARELRLAWAARYSWDAHARTILDAYRRMLNR